jgi:uncharacterized protein
VRRFTLCFLVGIAWISSPTDLLTEGPAFDCEKAEGEVEELICGDGDLAALDRGLDEVFKAAMAAVDADRQKLLRAEQRGWIKGRNDCWKEGSVRGCVEANYRFRISELQAAYRLAPARGPFTYTCDDNPASEIEATFFKTDPPTARLERGDQQRTVWLVATGSGSRYEGQNVIFWAKRDEATVTWLDEKFHCSIERN